MASSLPSAFLIVTMLLVTIELTSANPAAKLYWSTKLPNTPMPASILDSLAAQDNGDVWLSTHNKAHKWTHSDEVMLKGYEGGGHCHTDAMSNSDILASTFFLEKDMTTVGSKISVHFRDGSGTVDTRFPSKALAQSIPPFKLSHLSNNLQYFNADPKSEAAMFMKLTLTTCEHPNLINGKNQYCATSVEKLVSYVTSTLGGSQGLKTLSAPLAGIHRDEGVPYKVVGVCQMATQKNMVACHRLGFPYAVYYCHQPKGTTAYEVSVVDVESGVKTSVNAVCHTETSEWSEEYVGFKVLGVKPGTHVCHFLQFHDLVWFRG